MKKETQTNLLASILREHDNIGTRYCDTLKPEVEPRYSQLWDVWETVIYRPPDPPDLKIRKLSRFLDFRPESIKFEESAKAVLIIPGSESFIFIDGLPAIPASFHELIGSIEHSKSVYERTPDPDEEEPLISTRETWIRAMKIFINHITVLWRRNNIRVKPPSITPGPDGSVDIFWKARPHGLLLNIPSDIGQPCSFFGDDRRSPDTNRTSGILQDDEEIDPGILAWLAHLS